MTADKTGDKTNLAGDRLLNLKQCAERLCVCERTTYELWHAGAIPTVYVGRLRRCRESDLAHYIKQLA